MAGDKGRIARKIQSGLRFQHTYNRKRYGHESGLRVFGERKRFGRPFENRGTKLTAKCGIHFLEYEPRRREIRGQRLAHSDSLAALPRKNERNRHIVPVNYVSLRGNRAEEHRDAGSVKPNGTGRRPPMLCSLHLSTLLTIHSDEQPAHQRSGRLRVAQLTIRKKQPRPEGRG